jgi:hypothetical protein
VTDNRGQGTCLFLFWAFFSVGRLFFQKNIFFEQENEETFFANIRATQGRSLRVFIIFSRSFAGCGKTIWQSSCVFKTSPFSGKLDETIIAARLERNFPRCRNTTFIHLSGGRHVSAAGARRP